MSVRCCFVVHLCSRAVVSVCNFASVSNSADVSLYLCVYVSVWFLCRRYCVHVWMCVYVSLCLCGGVSLYRCVCASVCFCVCVSLCLCVFVLDCLCVFLSLFRFVSMCVGLCIGV